jgi:hypothetical protein
VLLDISKAFDKVWHEGLISKLKFIGIKGTLLKWLESYLSNSFRRVVVECKLLGGMQSATRTEPTSFLKHIDAGRKSSLKNLANIINNTFLAPKDSFTPWLLLGPRMSILTTRPPLPNIVCLRNLHYSTLIKPQAQTTCPHGC